MRYFRRMVFSALLALPLAAASLQLTKPEDVGLSSERLQRIHQMVQRHIDAQDVTGAVTLVARRGRVAHLEAQGVTDLDSKRPMPKDAIFRIASMSKPVTGVAILMLMEEGKVGLLDPVSKFIPEFKGMKVAVAQPAPGPASANNHADPGFYTVPPNREITIRDLLTHTSGLVSGPISSAEQQKIARQPNEKLADYIPRLAITPLEFQPGSRWSYSPLAAFDTLGRIVEIASGKSFDQFLRTRIFEPLGMNDTFFYPSDALMPRVVGSYQKTEKGLEPRKNPNFLSSATYFSGGGGLMSTAEDYAQFALMLANGGEWNGKRLLGSRTVALMGSAHVQDTLPGRRTGEGFGLSVRVIQDGVAGDIRISDGGFGWSGAFGTHFWVEPKEKIAAVLMIQTPINAMRTEFENAVMQSIID